ncbi:MAG: PLP-dependent aspartate aminotransferase family protein [Bacteroidales bacterium]
MQDQKTLGFSTKAIHIGEEPDFREGKSGDVVIPIHLSSTFARKEVEKPTGGYEYSRTGNPTRDALEKKYAALENARYGLAFASGLAAQSTLILALLKPNDHIIAFNDLYGGSKRIFNHVINNFNIITDYVDATNPELIEKAINPKTKLIWVESPTNPLMKLCDIKAISTIAEKHNLIFVVDNTFLTPYFQNPVSLGADIVIHSATKYLSGHSDVVSGAIVLSDDTMYEKIKFYQNAIGAIPSPFDCYLILRGLKTLAVRMEKHQENALIIAGFLESHNKVKKVIYPGLKSHPQYNLAVTQASGFGGMISFEIIGGINEAKRFLEKLKIFSIAESLGGVESLIEHPALMTHSSLPLVEREEISINDSLIRISIGIEDVEDLLTDLKQALN